MESIDSFVPPRVWLEINKEVIKKNVDSILNCVAPLKLMAVLKADAYGMGAELVSSLLSSIDISAFGVAELSRAMQLEPKSKSIHILGAILPEEVECAVQHGFVIPLSDSRIAHEVQKAARHLKRDALVQFKIDTGMGRLGVLPSNFATLLDEVRSMERLKVVGAYSHFPIAYKDPEFSKQQIFQFKSIVEKLLAVYGNLEFVHIANSDAIHNVQESLLEPFNMVRSGINLYGAFDIEGARKFDIEFALTLKAKLIAIRELPAGSTIGYGCTCVLKKPTLVGTVAIGYADGVPCQLGNKGSFELRGVPCKILGRVSMDFTTICLDDVPNPILGEEVVCLGESISIYDWAKLKGSNTYEILCSFGPRVVRKLV